MKADITVNETLREPEQITGARRRIIEQVNGFITVQSTEGQGSSFVIELPL